MSDSFDKLVQEFQEYADLLEFAKAQHKTIISLTKKIQKLEKEQKSLKIVPTTEATSNDETPSIVNVSDEEIICRTQLNILKNASLERELTLEETRKVDMYSKILLALENRPKTIEVTAKNLKDSELLSVINSDDETN